MPVYLADPKGFPRFPEADLNMKEQLTQLLSLLSGCSCPGRKEGWASSQAEHLLQTQSQNSSSLRKGLGLIPSNVWGLDL